MSETDESSAAQDKYCTGCKTQKPRAELYKSRQMADGLNPRCKDCMMQSIKRSRARQRQSSGDVELAALTACVTALETLDDKERGRVLAMLNAREQSR